VAGAHGSQGTKESCRTDETIIAYWYRMSRVTCKCFGYWRIAGCQSERHPPSRRETDAAGLPGGTEATSGGKFQVHPGDSQENAVFADSLCAEAAH
jgi:hypothetical protein